MKRGQLYDVVEASRQLGLKPRTIRRWVFLNKISYVKVGGAVRITDAEIERIVREGTVARAQSHISSIGFKRSKSPERQATSTRLDTTQGQAGE